jgi:hypothetical protein
VAISAQMIKRRIRMNRLALTKNIRVIIEKRRA